MVGHIVSRRHFRRSCHPQVGWLLTPQLRGSVGPVSRVVETLRGTAFRVWQPRGEGSTVGFFGGKTGSRAGLVHDLKGDSGKCGKLIK